jgi:hypothetical protein
MKIDHRIEKLEEKHVEFAAELKEIATNLKGLSTNVNRAAWILIGGFAVVSFLTSGSFGKAFQVGEAVSQVHIK